MYRLPLVCDPHAAVCVDVLSGDPVAVVAGQEHHHRRYILIGIARPLKGVVLEGGLRPFLDFLGLQLQACFAVVGVTVGHDLIDADVQRSKLPGQGAGQPADRRLYCGIYAVTGGAFSCCLGGKVDDDAP